MMHTDRTRWQTVKESIKDTVKKVVGKENESEKASRRYPRDLRSPNSGDTPRAERIEPELTIGNPKHNPNLGVRGPTIIGNYDKSAQAIGNAPNQLLQESKVAQRSALETSNEARFNAAKVKHDYGMDAHGRPNVPPREH
jgi:hypothetical protein